MKKISPDQIDTIFQETSADTADERNGAVLLKLSEHLKSNLDTPEVLSACYELCKKLAADPAKYDTIISDDASGRLPSLLLKEILDQLRIRQNLPPLKIWFLSAGRNRLEQREAIAKFINQHLDDLHHALIVTEIVDSGESMKNFSQIFKNFSLLPDIASVSAVVDPSYYQGLFVNQLIVGQQGRVGGYLHGEAARFQAGVSKQGMRQPSAHPQSLREAARPGDRVDVQREVNRTRQEIGLIAKVFLKLLEIEEKEAGENKGSGSNKQSGTTGNPSRRIEDTSGNYHRRK